MITPIVQVTMFAWEASNSLAFTQMVQSEGTHGGPEREAFTVVEVPKGNIAARVKWALECLHSLPFSVLFVADGVWKEVGTGQSLQSDLFGHDVHMPFGPCTCTPPLNNWGTVWGHCPETLCVGFQMLAPDSVSSYLMLSGRLSIHVV